MTPFRAALQRMTLGDVAGGIGWALIAVATFLFIGAMQS